MRCELPNRYVLERHFVPAGFRPLSCNGEAPGSELCKFPRVTPTFPPTNSGPQSPAPQWPGPISVSIFLSSLLPPQALYPPSKLDYLLLESINSSDKRWSEGDMVQALYYKNWTCKKHESIFRNSNPCVMFSGN